MASELLQTILRYLLQAVAKTSVKELFLHLRKWREKHSAHARCRQYKRRKPRRVAGNYRVARFTLRMFPNSNFGYSVISSERMLSKSGHRLPSEGEAICVWSGVFVEMVLSFMVLGLSNSPYFLLTPTYNYWVSWQQVSAY
jgi:hypothetical protein